mgnify:CR=1 FL=1
MKRDFTYIDDIVLGIRAAINKNYLFEIFNLGNNQCVNLMDIVGYIEKELNTKASIEFLPIQPGDVKSTNADIEKSKKLLDYHPLTSVDQGIKKFINWYKGYNTNL